VTLTEALIAVGMFWVSTIVAAAWFGYDWGREDRQWRLPPAWWRRPRDESNPYPPAIAQAPPPLMWAEREQLVGQRITTTQVTELVQLDRRAQAAGIGADTGELARLYGDDYPKSPGPRMIT
jgi:hypothetical protein